MTDFDAELQRRVDAIRAEGLHRQLRELATGQSARIQVIGRAGAVEELLNFSSNDYLGLANDPLLKEVALKAVERYGAGSGASRLICGSLPPHRQLEQALAAFKNSAAALSFSSGYSTAVGTICALMGKEDVVVLDKLVHASIVDAARLSGATLRVFPHNDLNRLEAILRWADARRRLDLGKVLVVTESVFSMDGDHAPLREIADIKDRHGAWLMVDEAHATGLYGPQGRGLAEELEVAPRIEIKMGTLGKALGSAGGFICGSKPLIDLLVNRARSFIFSTAPAPAASAAAAAAIEFVQSPAGADRRAVLWDNVSKLMSWFGSRRWASSIVPVHVGVETEALAVAARLWEQGFFVPAIRYPTVARGCARLRVTLTASHDHAEIDALGQSLAAVSPGLRPGSPPEERECST